MPTRIAALSTAMLLLPAVLLSNFAGAADPEAAYSEATAILQKYCTSCHNNEDREGGLALDTFTRMQEGGEHGPAFVAGDSKTSRMIRMLTGQAKPAMPPEDSEAPTEEEIRVLRNWIDSGARGPDGAEPVKTLRTPKIAGKSSRTPVADIAISPDGRLLAKASFRTVTVQELATGKTLWTSEDHPGKVNAIRFSADGELLTAASGIAGLYGVAKLWKADSGEPLGEFRGHDDVVYAAVLSPDRSLLATCSYDRKIVLWDVDKQSPVRVLSGHNDAVYDMDFSPDGLVLASASGDETVKLWRVSDGRRLDTLGQPQGEQYVVRFSPDGRFVVGGGVDNRIRVWRFVSKEEPRINPLVYARFAHEGPVISMAFTRDGQMLLSAAEDRSLKVWSASDFTQLHDYPLQSDVVSAIATEPETSRFWVARLDGSVQAQKLVIGRTEKVIAGPATVIALATDEMKTTPEQEPNGLDKPQLVAAPVSIEAVMHDEGRRFDVDVFRFRAKAGEQWVLETRASDKSPLDSFLEVLDDRGQSIPRVRLQAVRDSYFTFRGKDSDTINDFRLHNWEEMELNEYLFCNGEVVKLWLYPRGPDSGFKVYPGEGKRFGFFDTTPMAHALQEPCYIVEPHAPGDEIIPNGLPVFTLYYENDDESRRKSGRNARVNFTAPRDGEYLARVTDVRGHQGADYKYQLKIRPARPDFRVRLDGANPTVNAGAGKEFVVRVERLDGFDGEVRVDIENLPPGFHATTPLIVQAGQFVAHGVLHCDEGAPAPTAENAKASRVVASAQINGEARIQDVNNLGEIKLAGKSKVVVRLRSGDGDMPQDGPLELTIAPGQTIKARVLAERNGFDGIISFGNEDSGRNLPHGVYVDNIGLNGLMLLAKQNEREFFLTAAKWVPETTRTFHLTARVEGNQTTVPVILHVRKR